jgi:phosphoribosylformylglycinamidine cyclo-ligase
MAKKKGKSSKRGSNPKAGGGMTYAQSGVDIEAGDRTVDLIKGHLKRTYSPRVLGKHGAFAGCFRLDFNERLFKRNYKDPVLVACTDGVGTKVMLAVEMGVHDTIGQDCVAMNVNDLIVQGAEPLFFLDYVGVNKVVPKHMEQIVKGVADGCQLAGCALIGGETSEMPAVYKKGDYDLAGFSVGVCELKRVIDGQRVEKGDIVIALPSSGIHSNGYSLVRAIIKKAKLDLNKVYPELDDDRPLGLVLLEPTRIYSKQIVSLLRAYKVKRPISGMAHITGGGLPGNVNRALHDGVNAKLSKKAWGIPPLFKFIQKHGNVSDEEMFKVFNMGVGYTLIVKPHFADAILDKLQKLGEEAFVLGKITAGTGRVVF